MKISKSKQELARIISENGGWRNGAEFAWYGNKTKKGWFGISKPRYSPKQKSLQILRPHLAGSFPCRKPNNWHQTILSRAEYFHLYPAPDADGWIEWKGGERPIASDALVVVKMRGGSLWANGDHRAAGRLGWMHDGDETDIIAYRLHKPEQAGATDKLSSEAVSAAKAALMSDSVEELVRKPTIEQLAADYRNLLDFARRKQQEADDAKADADARLKALEIAGEAIGLLVSPIIEKQELELVITDWRDLQVGDEIEMLGNGWSCDNVGKIGVVRRVEGGGYIGDLAILCDIGEEESDWGLGFKFIRRP